MTLFALARSVTNRRADGGPSDSSLIKISNCQQTPQNDGRRLRGIPFLPCIQWTTKNVCIRVHSWLIINDFVAAKSCAMYMIFGDFQSRKSSVTGICVAARFHPSSMAWTVRTWCPDSVSLVSQRYSEPVDSAIRRLSTNQRYLSILR